MGGSYNDPRTVTEYDVMEGEHIHNYSIRVYCHFYFPKPVMEYDVCICVCWPKKEKTIANLEIHMYRHRFLASGIPSYFRKF